MADHLEDCQQHHDQVHRKNNVPKLIPIIKDEKLRKSMPSVTITFSNENIKKNDYDFKNEIKETR